MTINIEIINGHYLLSSSETGAMSLFSPAEYLAFNYIINEDDKEKALKNLLYAYGCDDEKVVKFSDIFLKKIKQQGWLRKKLPDVETVKLAVVYFTITSHCNLSCKYCYIGDERRKSDYEMGYSDAVSILKKIKEFNPYARVAVTGGEPLTHPYIFEILNTIDEFGLKFSLGTNAVLIDDKSAKKFKEYKNLIYIQASLDGITPETHNITRGDSFYDALKGIHLLIRERVPFAISPTIHEGNLHEIYDIAKLAYDNGGLLAPNHLRKFPHSHRVNDIYLKPESLRKCIIETFGRINKEYPRENYTNDIVSQLNQECYDFPEVRSKFVCGNAWFNADINWNGDVYPCHLLREEEFKIGNILKEDFDEIFKRSKNCKTRVKSYEIPKCRECPFVSTCAGGCRASAFYTNGDIASEDEFCEILYKFEVDKLFLRKDIKINSYQS